MAYGDFKDVPRRTATDIILRGKAFSISKNSKYQVLVQWFMDFLVRNPQVVLLHVHGQRP